MAQRRDLLLPHAATNEGSRRLRLLLRRLSFGAIARYLRCDESAVRAWAKEKSKPSLTFRGAAERTPQIAIPEWTWDDPPIDDIYAGAEPETTKRGDTR